LLAYGNGLNIKENSAAQAQTPRFKGGVFAGTALFSLATVVAYGGERVKSTSEEKGACRWNRLNEYCSIA